jgi:histone H3/H4
MTKLKGIEDTRKRERPLLYKKQLKKLLTNGRIGKNFYETLNAEYKTEIKKVLDLAVKEANEQKRKTINGTDIKKALQQQRETYASYIVENLETIVIGKLKEMKENIKGVKQWTTKTQ